MIAINLWNYFKGYVIIRVEGLTLEKFINLAINKDIYLWNIIRIDHTILEGKISIEGFKLLKEVVKKVGCRVYIIEKRGFPFLLEKLKKRKMFGFGFLLFIGLIIFLTSFIWTIEVSGNEKVPEEEIIQFLQNMDIKRGIIKYNVDDQKIRNQILDNFNIFSFASVDIKGTKLYIEVKEQDLPPEQIDDKTPCNIIAKKKGIIEKVIAKSGKKVVNEGDIVEKGQLLITGVIEDEMFDENLLIHAEGEVFAITRYAYTIEESIEKEVKEETGRILKNKGLMIGEKSINFTQGEIPFRDYIVVEREKDLLKIIPIKLLIHEYREVEISKIKQNVDSLKIKTQVLGIQEINKILPENSKILSKNVTHSIQGNNLVTVVILEVLEDIGEKQIIYNGED